MVLSGEIDVHTVQTFEARTGSVGQAPSPTTPVAVVDPTAVTFIDCCGLGLLVRCTQSARDAGRHPILRGITPTGTASAPTDRPHDAVQHGPHLIRTRTSRRPPAPPSRV